ncbi:winged helix-turn-helix transcriptional regulator [Pseudemcibacter aquimaris]|uniref:winged helix-turn-helix transcriptional regulator n=1 Tax=Pseudemcibacter aquimaris TaxID=2857064 RepID=UPI002012084A|nr:helix-turn-helix domain-containing protein [Pseudemcibacter aquimaris]MCC3859631.1 helix-turn-helix transcriptional regulator [Pseudemcibacter aquimaris]WDU60027.1 helix-turn-helix transcriptional regulator [Pseudemcibacter aquimaris]
MSNNKKRSNCAVSSGLDIFGDKWTLLIIRDMMNGKSKFNEFEGSPEKIPSNILSSRLKMLQENGIIDKQIYQEKPVRYQYLLLGKGYDLMPILKSISKWSMDWGADVFDPVTNPSEI